MKYLPPFELIRRSVEISTVRGELRVTVSYENFVKILKTLIRGIEVDEAWYVRTYEDIGNAIKEGIVRSARQHFIDDGYFEGRLPFPIVVDEALVPEGKSRRGGKRPHRNCCLCAGPFR